MSPAAAVLARFATRACTEDPTLWTSDDDTDRQIALGGCLECPFLAACREQTIHSIGRGDIPIGVVQAGVAFDDSGAVDIAAHTLAGARELAAQINRPHSAIVDEAHRQAQQQELPDLSADEVQARLAPLDAAAEHDHRVNPTFADMQIRADEALRQSRC